MRLCLLGAAAFLCPIASLAAEQMLGGEVGEWLGNQLPAAFAPPRGLARRWPPLPCVVDWAHAYSRGIELYNLFFPGRSQNHRIMRNFWMAHPLCLLRAAQWSPLIPLAPKDFRGRKCHLLRALFIQRRRHLGRSWGGVTTAQQQARGEHNSQALHKLSV